MYRAFKMSGFPEEFLRKSLDPLRDYLGGRDQYDGAGMNLVPTEDTLTSGGDPVAATLTAYKSLITTGGTQAAETVSIPNGTTQGQRKLVEVDTLTDASDSVAIAVTNVDTQLHAGGTPGSIAGLELDAEGEYALLEWTGAKWNVLYTTGTIS